MEVKEKKMKNKMIIKIKDKLKEQQGSLKYKQDKQHLKYINQ